MLSCKNGLSEQSMNGQYSPQVSCYHSPNCFVKSREKVSFFFVLKMYFDRHP